MLKYKMVMETPMAAEQVSNFTVQRFSEIPQVERPKTLGMVAKLEKEVWPATESLQAPREKFELRAKIFPEGFLLISTPELGLAGVSTAEIINYDPEHPPISWEEITDNGWIKNTHDQKGNALYLVSVGAKSGFGVGTRLVQEQISLAKKLNLNYLVLGARIPGYHEYHKNNPSVSIEEYLALKNNFEPYDPEIRFYSRCGLKVIRIVPNYMEDDPESENYGAIMVWTNQNTPLTPP